jgi:hypothetical protein
MGNVEKEAIQLGLSACGRYRDFDFCVGVGHTGVASEESDLPGCF